MTASGFEEISPHRKYHGISVQIIGKIKNVRVSFNIDMGIGDAIVPHAMEQKIQTQLPDFESPAIFTYSLESTIAEKFDAILQRFELTGRMKDFYDIYYLASDSVYQKYRDEVIILLGTGLRISELCGLTETDLDFENRVINVDHQLLRSAETGYCKRPVPIAF